MKFLLGAMIDIGLDLTTNCNWTYKTVSPWSLVNPAKLPCLLYLYCSLQYWL